MKKGAKDSRFERVYYPIHPEGVAIEVVLACTIAAIAAANRILCQQVSAFATRR